MSGVDPCRPRELTLLQLPKCIELVKLILRETSVCSRHHQFTLVDRTIVELLLLLLFLLLLPHPSVWQI